MSLKQFLVVGKSFVGLNRDMSPYELRKENLLPNFSPLPRFDRIRKQDTQMVQADWVGQQERMAKRSVIPSEQPELAQPAKNTEPALFGSAAALAPVPAKKKRRGNWLRILSFGLLGKSRNTDPLVQSELSLDRINVVRNDLADSDLELVLKKKKKTKTRPARDAQAPAPEVPPSWSRLTARLFEIGQEP